MLRGIWIRRSGLYETPNRPEETNFVQLVVSGAVLAVHDGPRSVMKSGRIWLFGTTSPIVSSQGGEDQLRKEPDLPLGDQ